MTKLCQKFICITLVVLWYYEIHLFEMPLRNALWFISYVHTYTHIYVYIIYIYFSKEFYACNCKHMSNLLKYFERTYVLRRKKIFLTNERKVRGTVVRTIEFEDNRNSFQALIINLLGKYCQLSIYQYS